MIPIDPAVPRAEAAWFGLRAYLEARMQAIGAEVRGYPTPIAACDVQLSELIERRDRALERLKAMRSAGRDDARERLDAMDAFLAGPPAFAGDRAEERLRDRLCAALHGMIRG